MTAPILMWADYATEAMRTRRPIDGERGEKLENVVDLAREY